MELRGTSYTVKEVVDATRNFSSKTEIGRGQYGIVYKVKHIVFHLGLGTLASESIRF